MMNVLLFSCVFITSFSIFMTSYSRNGAIKVINAYSVFYAQNAVSASDTGKEPPFFLEKEFRTITNRYFDKNLSRYLGSGGKWNVSFVFDDDAMAKFLSQEMLLDKRPQSAVFTITVSFNAIEKLVRTRYFIISEGGAYGW
ncbi:MAG: hypothetical protein MJ228_05120 [Bacilli bacterium]|nr:hypothetical protein [Bacilli bacterium]